MLYNKKQISQIKSALHNTLEKVKAHIRRTGEIPTTETVFEWFQQISEIGIVKDKPTINAADQTINKFEGIFYFNDFEVHVYLVYEHSEYRGHPYLNAGSGYTFINELDPDDYFDEVKIDYLKTKFGITPPQCK